MHGIRWLSRNLVAGNEYALVRSFERIESIYHRQPSLGTGRPGHGLAFARRRPRYGRAADAAGDRSARPEQKGARHELTPPHTVLYILPPCCIPRNCQPGKRTISLAFGRRMVLTHSWDVTRGHVYFTIPQRPAVNSPSPLTRRGGLDARPCRSAWAVPSVTP